MVGVCGAIWLVFLVVAVIAGVALAKLGRGGAPAAGESSSWLLYTIIGISAATILTAIPLLLRARRTALAAHAGTAGDGATPTPPARSAAPAVDAPTEKMRVFGATVDPYAPEPARAVTSPADAVIERFWLRGTVSILTAMGLALIGVATATYLLAVHSDTAAMAGLGVAGVITLGLPAILVALTRRAGEALR